MQISDLPLTRSKDNVYWLAIHRYGGLKRYESRNTYHLRWTAPKTMSQIRKRLRLSFIPTSNIDATNKLLYKDCMMTSLCDIGDLTTWKHTSEKAKSGQYEKIYATSLGEKAKSNAIFPLVIARKPGYNDSPCPYQRTKAKSVGK